MIGEERGAWRRRRLAGHSLGFRSLRPWKRLTGLGQPLRQFSLLGGQLRSLLVQLSRLTPHAWFVEGVSDLAGGAAPSGALLPVAVLALIGLVSGGLGLVRGRRLVLP